MFLESKEKLFRRLSWKKRGWRAKIWAINAIKVSNNKQRLAFQPTINTRTYSFIAFSLDSRVVRAKSSWRREISREFDQKRRKRGKKKLYYILMLIRTPKKFSCLWASPSDVSCCLSGYSSVRRKRHASDVIVFVSGPLLFFHIFFIIKNLK